MKGIIFDMDGTMVDNMMVHHRAWQRELAALGLELSLEEVQEKIHGINEEILERLFGDRFSPEERKAIAARKEAAYREIFLDELRLIDGLPELLEALHQHNVPMAVGTAAPMENVEFVLSNLPIRHYFQAVFHAGSVSKGKPDPEIFLKAAAALGLAPEDCIVFEDSPTGAEAALRAGCASVIINTTHEPEEFLKFPNVRRQISDYRDLQVVELLGF